MDGLHLHGAGWQAHVEDLAGYLVGHESRWMSRWDELNPTYRSMAVS